MAVGTRLRSRNINAPVVILFVCAIDAFGWFRATSPCQEGEEESHPKTQQVAIHTQLTPTGFRVTTQNPTILCNVRLVNIFQVFFLTGDGSKVLFL